jgi:hypothetical protein
MRALPFQLLLILATILGLADVSDAASVEPNRAPDADELTPVRPPVQEPQARRQHHGEHVSAGTTQFM